MPYLIGSAANQVPVNGMLGTAAFQDADNFKAVNLTVTGNATLGDAEASDTHAIKGATTLLANSASAALTVTQTGSGNAFVVEDSTSPDSTPFIINAAGIAVAGHTASIPGAFSDEAPLQCVVAGGAAQFAGYRFSANTGGTNLYLYKSRGATAGTNTIVQSGDVLGAINFAGADGTTYHRAAQILGEVDGTPGTNDMPGRLVFSTTADGASSPTEAMRIDSKQKVTITPSTTTAATLNIPHGTAPTSPVNGDVWTTTTGVFARVNGSTKTLDVVSAGLTLLATVTPTAAANVDFLTTFSGTYDNYLVVGSGVKFANNEGLIIRLANAGTADTGSNYVNMSAYDIEVTTRTTSGTLIATGISSANSGCNFQILIQNVNSASELKTITCESTRNGTTSVYAHTFTNASVAYTAANTVSGLRLASTGGSNFAAVGKIRVYGYSNS